MGTETNKDDRNTPEYLAQLLKDKKQIQALPNVFVHVEKLLDEEINRVRVALFHHQGKKDLTLPEPHGPIITLSEKLFVPVKDHPDFNFVGRILGPRGMTAKELEQYTGCKIMVRGKGSMRDKGKEEQNRGKANWEHLNEDLHVLITVEDTRNRAEMKLSKAVEEVKRLLVPAPEGEDDLKKKQLMELAILNGTYRDQKALPMMHQFHHAQRFLAQPIQIPMRTATPSPAGAPIILAPRMPMTVTSGASIMNGAPPPLISPNADGSLMYNPYEHHYHPYGLATPTILEYPAHFDPTAAAAAAAAENFMGVHGGRFPYALQGPGQHMNPGQSCIFSHFCTVTHVIAPGKACCCYGPSWGRGPPDSALSTPVDCGPSWG